MVVLCSLEGGVESAKENGKKSPIIVTRDNWEIIQCSAGAHVLSATDVHLTPYLA